MRPQTPEASELFSWASELFPMGRSLTGQGVRDTLTFIKGILPDLELHSIESGTQVFDWQVPDEWNVRSAWIRDATGNTVADYTTNNLHLVGYSTPIKTEMDLEELDGHLYSLPEMPDAIPYVTSYYERRWGFCLSDRVRRGLSPGRYSVSIDTELKPGMLDYADLVLPGRLDDEIMFTTYICHPSMANNEVSGPVVTTALAKVMSEIKERRFTYRFVFAPETIGPLVYMSEHLENLQERVQAGWVVTCVGDRRTYSYLASRTGSTLADRISLFALHDLSLEFRTYSFLQRGSDERQWNSPGANLPFCSLMRSKYGEYPEYHTSLDDLSLISGEGLAESLTLLLHCVYILENNRTYVSTVVGEPQLGRRGLYSTLSRVGSADDARTLLDVLAYCDGRNDLVAISRTLSKPFSSVLSAVETLKTHALLKDA